MITTEVASGPDEDSLGHETQRAEFKWLLTEIIPPVLSELQMMLYQCVPLLESTSKLVVSSPRSEILKGHIVRDASELLKGEFAISLPGFKRGSVLRRVQIRPIMLQQVNDALQYIKMSLELLQIKDIDGYEALGSLVAHLNLAESALQKPDPDTRFPNMLLPANIFDPPLPSDINMSFFISMGIINVELRHLDDLGMDPLLTNSPSVFRKRKEGQIVQIDDTKCNTGLPGTLTPRSYARIVEYYTIESIDPTLVSVLSKISSIRHMAEISKTKLDAVHLDE